MRPGLTVAGGRDGAAVPTPAAAGSRWWSAADGGCTRRSSGRSRPAPGAGAVVAAVDQLDLEGGEERLGDGVVQARAGAAHGTPQPQPLADVDAGGRGVFAAAVGVEDRAVHPAADRGWRRPPPARHRPGQASWWSPIDQPSRWREARSSTAGQVQPALVGGDVGEVAAQATSGRSGRTAAPPGPARVGRRCQPWSGHVGGEDGDRRCRGRPSGAPPACGSPASRVDAAHG